MKVTLADLAIIAGLVALWIGFKSGNLNPASRDNVIYQATGQIGLKVPDWFGGIFKSDAEKAVDEMLKSPVTPATMPTQKPILVPGSYYDLGAKPVPTGEARVIGTSGVLTSGSYRDLVR